MFELDKITLKYYKDDNKEHKKIKNELLKGKSFSKYIKQVDERLIDKKKDNFSLDSAYLVSISDKIIGYVFISDIQKYKIYIEYNILKDYRHKGFGKLILSEVTAYLLSNYSIREIALDIDVSNLSSINLAESCGYYMEEEFDKNTSINSKEFTYINPDFNAKLKKLCIKK